MEADVSLAQKSSTWGGAIELAVCHSVSRRAAAPRRQFHHRQVFAEAMCVEFAAVEIRSGKVCTASCSVKL